EDIIRAVLSEGVSLLGGHSATVHVLDDACSELVMMGSVGAPPEMLLEAYGRLPVDAPLPAIDAMRLGTPVIVRTMEERRARYPKMAEGELAVAPASAGVPLS